MKGTYTEEQAINITIDHGYSGEEFQTSIWKQRGCLKINGSYDKLISKLNTIYNYVEVKGKGKKRQYILKDKKDIVSERKFNYKGSVPTEEDLLMTEYIFNKLIHHNGHSHSYKGWSNVIGLMDTDQLRKMDFYTLINNIHKESRIKVNHKEIAGQFIQTITYRNKDVIEKSFQRLQKDNRIIVNELYFFKSLDNEYIEVSEDSYNSAQESLIDFLKQKEISLFAYTQSVISTYKPEKMKKVIEEVNDFLSFYFEIKYFFKTYKVMILNHDQKQNITKDEFLAAYNKRLIKLTYDKQEKDKYKNSVSFWRRFYLYNTLSILDHLGIKNLKEDINKLKHTYRQDIDNFSIDLLIHYSERKELIEKRKNSFGKL